MRVASPFELSLTKIRTCLFKVHFQTVGVAILILIICGIAPISAAIAVVEFSITLLVGAKLAATALERPLSSYEFIGFGFVFGAPLAVAISQLFLLFTTPTISSFAPILIGTTYLLTNKKQLKQVNYATTLNHEVIFEILVIAMLLFSTIRLWLLPLSLSLITVHFAQRKPTGFRVLFSTLVVVVGIVVSMHMRTEFWWYTNSNDSAYFESISWSINQWGFFENPGYFGGSVAKYHWMSYAWSGHLSQVSRLESWQALNIVSPIFCAIAATGAFGSILRENWKLLPNMRLLLIYCGVSSIGIVVSLTSLNYSFIGLIVLMLIVRQMSRIRFAKQLSTLIYLISVIFLSKITSGFVAISLVLAYAPLLLKVKSRNFKFWVITGPIVLLVSAVGLNYWTNHKIASLGNIENLRAALSQLESPYFIPVFASCVYLIFNAIQSRGAKSMSDSLATPLLFLSSLIYFLLGATVEGEYIIYAVSTFVIFEFYKSHSSHYDDKSRHILLFPGVGIIALGFWFFRHPLLGDLNSENSLVNLMFHISHKYGIGLTILIITLMTILRVPHKSNRIASYGVLVLFLLNIGIQFDSGWRIIHQSSDSYEQSVVNAAPHADLDLRDMATFINRNTMSDIVLASNNFCCFGVSWFNNDLALYESGNLVKGESSLGGANFLLPAHSKRRFLIQGPRFMGAEPTADLIRRMHLSLEFANSPTIDVVKKLKEYHVSAFVVNLSLTKMRDWSEFAVTKYSNEKYSLLMLK